MRSACIAILLAGVLGASGQDAAATTHPTPSPRDAVPACVEDALTSEPAAVRPVPRLVAAPVVPVGAAWLRDVAAERPSAAADAATRERFIADRVAATTPPHSPRTAIAIIAAVLAGLAGIRACRWLVKPQPDEVTGIISRTGRITVAVGHDTGLYAITTKRVRVTTKKYKQSA